MQSTSVAGLMATSSMMPGGPLSGMILRPFREAGSRVLTLRPAPQVGVRNRAERTRYREAAFRRYFRQSRLRYLDRSHVTVTGRCESCAAAEQLRPD